MNLSVKAAFLAIALTLPLTAFAWEGTDSDTGNSVTIDQGNLVWSGNDIQYYDADSGGYKSATVDAIDRNGSTVDVQVTDDDSGDTHTLSMQDDD